MRKIMLLFYSFIFIIFTSNSIAYGKSEPYICGGYLIWAGKEEQYVNIRSNPSIKAPIIDRVKSLTIIKVIDITTGKDKLPWYKIHSDEYVLGWVRGDFVMKDDCH
jgi:hypothetical protein